MTPRTSATPIQLERYRVTKLNEHETPFERNEKGEWVTNRVPVRVQRMPGKPRNVSLKSEHGYAALLTRDEVDAVRKVAERRNWVLDLRRADLYIPRYPNLEGDLDCSPDLLRRLQQVAEDLAVVIFVRSGARTMDEQWALYRELGPTIAAYPSASAPHVRGIAADCGINGVNIGAWPKASEAMLKYGLCLRVTNENWHVEVGGRNSWATNWLPK